MKKNPKQIILLERDEYKKHSRRNFISLALGVVFSFAGLSWIFRSAGGGRPEDGPLRAAFLFNESIWRKIFSPQRLESLRASQVPPKNARVNGDIGLDEDLDLSDWNLALDIPGRPDQEISLEALKKMPQVNSQGEFRCVEGWSMPIAYSGIRLSDFLKAHGAEIEKFSYVGMETPNGEYYISIDMESACHPQTILALSLNGAELSEEHGAPLRLIIPVKYGIKNLKRIGRIFLANERPDDYWAERGYDWYSGL